MLVCKLNCKVRLETYLPLLKATEPIPHSGFNKGVPVKFGWVLQPTLCIALS